MKWWKFPRDQPSSSKQLLRLFAFIFAESMKYAKDKGVIEAVKKTEPAERRSRVLGAPDHVAMEGRWWEPRAL